MRIFLVGFMGSGKSHWGKIWALKHNYAFFDLDEQVEQREQRSVAEIFETSGEEIFRLLETKMLRDITRNEDCIISCGGGTPCFHENMKWMNEKGCTLYLSAPPGYLFENIRMQKDKRPLINTINEAELLFFTEKKLIERLPFYEAAQFTLAAQDLNKESLEKIITVSPGNEQPK